MKGRTICKALIFIGLIFIVVSWILFITSIWVGGKMGSHLADTGALLLLPGALTLIGGLLVLEEFSS